MSYLSGFMMGAAIGKGIRQCFSAPVSRRAGIVHAAALLNVTHRKARLHSYRLRRDDAGIACSRCKKNWRPLSKKN